MARELEPDGVIGKYLRQISGCFVGNFYWKDKNGRYLGSNESTLYMSGKKIEVVGKTDYDIWPERAEQLRKNDIAVMESGTVLSFEETIQVGNDTKHYAVLKVPMKDENGNIIGIIGNSVDITERKELEFLKRGIEEQKRINELVSNLVHDIRTPLLILGNFAKVCKNLTENEHVILRECVFSIQNIVQSLLSKYKNQDPSEKESIQSILVPQALEEIVFRRKFQKKGQIRRYEISFRYDSLEDFVFIRGNASDFERMMDNLINNAIEALRGSLRTVDVLLSCDDLNIKITIKDSGIGVSTKVAEQLMNGQPVPSLKKNGHGIGTRQIQAALRDLEGSMLVESREGVGTKIALTIPRAPDPSWVIKKLKISPSNVLVILDDDISMHNVWKQKLAEFSVEMHFFSRSQEALDFISSFPQKSDLLLLFDYEMRSQELNGLDAIVESGLQSNAVLVSSAYGHIDIQQKATAEGVKIIPKSFVDRIPIEICKKEEANNPNFSNNQLLGEY